MINLKKNQDESGFVIRIQRGDKEAFSQMYYEYYGKMCNYAFSIIKLSEESEELVQDVFLNIWNMHETWQPKGSIRSYLYKAIKNKALDFIKHQKVEKDWARIIRESHNLDMGSPEDDYCFTELARMIEVSINKLPDRRKMIFLLNREHGLSYVEISNVLDISVKTIETQMGRALTTLRKVLVSYLSN